VTRTVAVTGATGGIGVAIVAALRAAGYGVIAVGRSEERLAELGSDDVATVALDFTGPFTLPPALAGLERLDGLVHCAGIAEVQSVAETSYELWQETLTVNVIAAAELTRALLPALREASGTVVFVNAAPGLHGVPNWSAYVASKSALTELADSLREEEDAHGIRVTSIYPAGVATELLRKVRGQFGRPFDPDACVRPETLAWLVVTALDFPDDAHLTEVSIRPAPSGRPRT
jgi:NADP-dependent 3-hydroxy acid dehydrogenase YdfG